jgi:transposase-like protein
MDENKGVRRNHPPAFRAKVAIEALKEQKTISQISSQFGIHSSLVTKWKAMAYSGLESIFSGKKAVSDRDQEELVSQLYQQIGQLKVQIDWLKKKMGLIE